MALNQPRLPKPTTSALLIARDQIVEDVEEWSFEWRKSATIGHAGKVTPEFLKKQAGHAPRSIITVIRGNNERIAGGGQTLFVATFVWFIVVGGVLKDRTTDGLTIGGEAVRLLTAPPWTHRVDSAFAMTPIAESVDLRPLYEDKDEHNGLSIWMLSWRQAVDMGTAQRASSPGPDPLAVVEGLDVIPGQPNDGDIETRVT